MKKRIVAYGFATLGTALSLVSPAHAQIEYVRNFVAAPNHGAVTITGFNNQGQVSGSYCAASNSGRCASHAFLWDPKTGFHDINLQIVCDPAEVRHDKTALPNAFVWNPKSGAASPMIGTGAPLLRTASAGDSGESAGRELAAEKSIFHTFQVTPSGRIQELKVEIDDVRDSSSLAIDVNHKGEIIGSSSMVEKFILSAGARPIRYTAIGHPRSAVAGLYRINDKGVVLAAGTEYDGTTGKTISGFLTLTPHQIPTNTAHSYTIAEGAPLRAPAGSLLQGVENQNRGALTAALRTTTTHGALVLRRNGSFQYTPAPNFHGSDRFEFQIFDGVSYSAPATVTIFVATKNDPTAAPDFSPMLVKTNTATDRNDLSRHS